MGPISSHVEQLAVEVHVFFPVLCGFAARMVYASNYLNNVSITYYGIYSSTTSTLRVSGPILL